MLNLNSAEMILYDAITHQLKNRMEVIGLSNRNSEPDSGTYIWTRLDVVKFALERLTEEDIAKVKKSNKIEKENEAKEFIKKMILEMCAHKGAKVRFDEIAAYILRKGVFDAVTFKYGMVDKWRAKL